jgi:hypothetical protein
MQSGEPFECKGKQLKTENPTTNITVICDLGLIVFHRALYNVATDSTKSNTLWTYSADACDSNTGSSMWTVLIPRV